MTEAEAMSACKTFMDESPSFKMCKDIPNVNPDIAMNTCVLDILVIFIKVVYLLKKIHVITNSQILMCLKLWVFTFI